MAKLDIGKNLSDLIKLYFKYMIIIAIIIVILFGAFMYYNLKNPDTFKSEEMKEAEAKFDENFESTKSGIEFSKICTSSDWKTNGCEGEPGELIIAAAEKYLKTTDILEIKMACNCPA